MSSLPKLLMIIGGVLPVLGFLMQFIPFKLALRLLLQNESKSEEV